MPTLARNPARFLAALALCAAASAQAQTQAGMVAAANPLAAAGLDALKRGGSVADAAMAVHSNA